MPTRLQNIHLVRELVGGKIEIIARRKYEWRLDRFVELDPSSIEGQS